MPLRVRNLLRLSLALAILAGPHFAYADKEAPRIKACILRFAEILKGRQSKLDAIESAQINTAGITAKPVEKTETIYADDVFDVARFEALEKEKPVHPTQATLATQRYNLAAEPFRQPIDGVDNVRSIPGVQLFLSGMGFHEALQGELNGQHVFIKISTLLANGKAALPRRSIQQFTNEVAWIKRLDALGIGPKFYGLTEKEGHRGIVTDFIDGVQVGLIPGVDKLPTDFRATNDLVASLEKMRAIIVREGIFPKDLQLRMTAERAFIVDPEYFHPATNVGEIEMAKTHLDELIAAVKTHIKN